MLDDVEDLLRAARTPAPSAEAKASAIAAAMTAYDRDSEKNPASTQGQHAANRLLGETLRTGRTIMKKWLMAGTAVTAALAAGYVGAGLQTRPMGLGTPTAQIETMASAPGTSGGNGAVTMDSHGPAVLRSAASPDEAVSVMMGPAREIAPYPSPVMDRMPLFEDRDRIKEIATGGLKSVAAEPVSTFSADVDTASYALVRSQLNMGRLPHPDTVRVEELVNYFPYDWPLAESAGEPFRPTVTVAPSPWTEGRKLMHVAIKGYDVVPEERPRSNLVFLVDVSGSMNTPDKLPLLKNAFRMLVSALAPEDTVAIVTYAGQAGTVLEPTPARDRDAILHAIDSLQAGGSTAGEAGIRAAYRLANAAFVEGGVNRVMLATDGDFNVGQTSDDDLKRLVEKNRESGVYLSVLGFGRGNYNDQLMQALAQNGNGTAAYIDSLAEAQKALVDEAFSTMFTIAADVKLQVEFNPAAVSEYRLVGYETRALAREDFANDRVDAGDVGSGHSVTAIYEITPKGSPAEMFGELRYGRKDAAGDAADASEYAHLSIRYKLPGEDKSRLIARPVTPDDEVADIGEASADVRFSVAVASFGQKLREVPALAGYPWSAVREMAAGARGEDPFGYRSGFLTLVSLAESLDRTR